MKSARTYQSKTAISPKMVEAGVKAYLDMSLEFDKEADIVTAIYQAMVSVKAMDQPKAK